MFRFFLFCLVICFGLEGKVQLGIDGFLSGEEVEAIRGKRVGLITNQSGVNQELIPTYELFLEKKYGISLAALFAGEHGLFGAASAETEVSHGMIRGIPVYSLHGKDRRPTRQMLENIDLLIYDVQEIGCRSYTYASTLYYVMEEAAKYKIPVIVLDRPNPLGGMLIDGPMLQEKYRSFIGYIDVPYCHGMTIGELALYFNGEYRIGCDLKVIPLKGWKREMTFSDTKLEWIPTSPYIPEPMTPFFYATTGLIGQLSIVSIGIGYTLPFRVVGAPWINGHLLVEKLQEQKLRGVAFVPFHFTPHYGLYKGELCSGVFITIQDASIYEPLKTQFILLGLLKSLYPKEFAEKINALTPLKKELFCKAVGGDEIFSLLKEEMYPGWKMASFQEKERRQFVEKRKKYLLY